MKTLVLALALVGMGGASLADERAVIVPMDEKPFTVATSDLVRLAGAGIAGSKIEIKVDGPAKVEATSEIRQIMNGRPLLGGSIKEFDLKPTGSGKVTATVTVTPPQPGAKAKVAKFEFEVQ